MLELHKVRVRAELEPRREPYWGAPIGRDGLTIGLRKSKDGTERWIARMLNPGGKPKYLPKPLGLLTEQFDYEAARAAALKWRADTEAGVTSDVFTVEDACKEYVEDREREKGKACAHDAKKRFERTVYGTHFGRTDIRKLRTPAIKRWRDGTKLKKAASNRTLTSLKAALNLAVENRRAPKECEREWADVKPLEGADNRRDVFLDRGQRLALLDRMQGALRDLVEAAALTGARAGELTSAKRSQFDSRTKTMKYIGKTGTRTVPLSDAAIALFARLAQSKLPGAHLFMRDDGRPWAHSDWDELLAEAAKLARLPHGVCLYTLRHCWITEALTNGISTLEVARLTGTSVVMIEKHYGHLVIDAARERLAKVQML